MSTTRGERASDQQTQVRRLLAHSVGSCCLNAKGVSHFKMTDTLRAKLSLV